MACSLFGFCYFADTHLLSVSLSTQQSADYGAPERTYRFEACHSDKWTKSDVANS